MLCNYVLMMPKSIFHGEVFLLHTIRHYVMVWCVALVDVAQRCFCVISFSGHHPIIASPVGAQIIIRNWLLNSFHVFVQEVLDMLEMQCF